MTTTTNLVEIRKLVEVVLGAKDQDALIAAQEDLDLKLPASTVIELLDTIETQTKQIVTLQTDAERYRWLKKNCALGIKQFGLGWSLNTRHGIAPDALRDVDAAIDAAKGSA